MDGLSFENKNIPYRPEKIISSAKFGHVWLGTNIITNKKVIIKEFNSSNEKELLINLLNTINHPSLACKSEVITNNNDSYIIRDFNKGISLKDLISDRKTWKKLPVNFWIDAFVYLLKGLEILHEKGVVHCDIKPSNILICNNIKEPISSWNPINIKLIDYEQAVIIPAEELNVRSPFALCYSPPEQLLHYKSLINPASDLFALSLTLYEAITGKKAFDFYDPEMLLHIQLNMPITNDSRLPTQIFEIIRKASFKTAFRLPPRQLTQEEVILTIVSGINNRYSSANELIIDLENCKTINLTTKKNLFSRIFNRFLH